MNQTDTIQNHIEITRQQIIGQLQEEIAHFQNELCRLSSDSDNGYDAWGNRIYRTIINRKRKLISALSCGVAPCCKGSATPARAHLAADRPATR
jgi:hypothetical protein